MKLALVLLVLGARVAVADPFDAMPKDAAAVATKVTGAIDGTDEAAVVALAPTSAQDALKKDIDGQGGLAKWRGTTSTWTAGKADTEWDVSTDTVNIVIAPADKGWRVASITRKLGYGVGAGGGGCGGMAGRTVNHAKVTIATPKVDHGDAAVVKRYLRRNLGKIQYCYEKDLLASPQAAGTIKARFTIDSTGAATKVTAKGVDDATASCVIGVIGGIQFPKLSAGRVSVKITFAPGAGG